MRILDSNHWVFGMLQTNDRAMTLLDEIDRGETTSAINASIVQEVLAAFAGCVPADHNLPKLTIEHIL